MCVSEPAMGRITPAELLLLNNPWTPLEPGLSGTLKRIASGLTLIAHVGLMMEGQSGQTETSGCHDERMLGDSPLVLSSFITQLELDCIGRSMRA